MPVVCDTGEVLSKGAIVRDIAFPPYGGKTNESESSGISQLITVSEYEEIFQQYKGCDIKLYQ